MDKNWLTETERATLKHILNFDNKKISRFENMNFNDKTREFLIFDMMVNAFEKGRKINEKKRDK